MSRKTKYVPAKVHVQLTPGETISILREKKGWTQQELSKRSSVEVPNISSLEHGRRLLGRRVAIRLADAFGIHPAVIMFPEYQHYEAQAA